jgi:hypothetical protein
MSAVDLTGLIKWSTGKPRFIDFGGELTPGLGGPVQRVNRLGNRFGIDVAGVPIPEYPDAEALVAWLRLAKQNGAIFPWPTPRGAPATSYGSPVVNGAVTAGTSVAVRGLTVGATIRFGQFFSIVTAGWRCLYAHAATAVVADGAGHATLTVDPMLRVSLADGDVVELATPKIMGFLKSGDLDNEIMLAPFCRIDFSIAESK